MAVTFPFEDAGKSRLGHIWRPVAKVTLTSAIDEKSIDIWMVIDTGADYTIIPRHFAEKLRISLERDCIKEITAGVGGEQTVYFYKGKLTAKIDNLERKIPLAFLDSNEVPALLGRLGFLETFDTEFLKSHKVIFKS